MSSQLENDNYWKMRQRDDQRKDWHDGASWIQGYWNSRTHPHREMILDALREITFKSLLEVGCNAGPNLALIRDEFKDVALAGIDVNEDSIKEAQRNLNKIQGNSTYCDVKVANAKEIPFRDKSFDVVLVDAVLMYANPDEITKIVDEIDRVVQKAIVLVEWDGDTKEGEIRDFHWVRDYKALFEEKGFTVEKHKIPKELWSTKTWTEHGYLYFGYRTPK